MEVLGASSGTPPISAGPASNAPAAAREAARGGVCGTWGAECTPLLPGDVDLFGWHVRSCGSVVSTNELVKETLREGGVEGVCFTALRQTGGYGRQGRAWASPVGGLYTSFALCPECEPAVLPTLGLALSLAVARAVERASCVVDVQVKWPNDVLCPQGKLAGISLEALSGGVCVGVGVNVFRPAGAQAVPGKYRVARLFDECVEDDLSAAQRAVMTGVLEALLEELACEYARWREHGFSSCRDEYGMRLAFVGSAATLETIDGSPLASGVIRGVDESGRLVVEAADGSVMRAASGEVHVSALG